MAVKKGTLSIDSENIFPIIMISLYVNSYPTDVMRSLS